MEVAARRLARACASTTCCSPRRARSRRSAPHGRGCTYARRRASLPTTCAASTARDRLGEPGAGLAAQLAVAVDPPHHADDAVPAQVDDTRLDAHRHEDVQPAGLHVGDRPAVEVGDQQHELRLGDGEERGITHRRADLGDRAEPGYDAPAGRSRHPCRRPACCSVRSRGGRDLRGRPSRMRGPKPLRGANDGRAAAFDHGRDRALGGAGQAVGERVECQVGCESHRTDCTGGPQVP